MASFLKFSLPLPDKFPEGSLFFEADGVAVLESPRGVFATLDGSFISSAMLWDFGKPLHEAEFRTLVNSCKTQK